MKKIMSSIATAALLATGAAVATPQTASAAKAPIVRADGNFNPKAKLDRTQVAYGRGIPSHGCSLKYQGNVLMAKATGYTTQVTNVYRVAVVTAQTRTATIRIGRTPVRVRVIPIRGDHDLNMRRQQFTVSGYYDSVAYKSNGLKISVAQYWKVSSMNGKTIGYGGCSYVPTHR